MSGSGVGNLLTERAIPIIQQLQDAKQAVRDFEGPPSGTVKFGIPRERTPPFPSG